MPLPKAFIGSYTRNCVEQQADGCYLDSAFFNPNSFGDFSHHGDPL